MIMLLLLATATTTATARTMTIDNRSSGVLRGVYLSPPTNARWGADLARDNLRIGVRTTVSLPGPGCHWDVRVLLDGRPAEQIFRNRDLCRRPIVVVDGRTRRFMRGSHAPLWN